MPPDFLQVDEILFIHLDQIERYGGAPGVRDTGLLQSAAAMPRASFGDAFLHRDLFKMAAALADLVLAVAQAQAGKPEIAAFFRSHVHA